MRRLLDRVMRQRGDYLATRVAPYLPARGRVLDIGTGTGHTAVALQRHSPLTIVGLDVVSLGVVGAPPVLFDGAHMPFADQSFAGALILYVLHYSPDPLQLLREARRVSAGPVLVLQSTHAGGLAEIALRLYDLAWGPAAFAIARTSRFISAASCPLYARALMSRGRLLRIFAQAGLVPRLVHSTNWPILAVRRDLFVLQRDPLARQAP